MSNKRDISLIAGDTYTQEVIFSESQEGYTFAATINSTDFISSMASDNVTLTLTLTAAQTAALNTDSSTVYKWRLRRYSADATPTVLTILYGKVLVTSE